MNGVIAGGVANIILDYVFVYPLQMGMGGAALATVIGSTLTVAILLVHFFSPKNRLKLCFQKIRPRFFWEITAGGFASFLIEAASGLTIFIFNLQLLKYTGNIGVTVYGVISNTAIVVICLCKGINQAAQPILSTNYGAGIRERIGQVRRLALRTSVLVCAVPVLLGLIVPKLFYLHLSEPGSGSPESVCPGRPDLFCGISVYGDQYGADLLFSGHCAERPFPTSLPAERMYPGHFIRLPAPRILGRYRDLAGLSRGGIRHYAGRHLFPPALFQSIIFIKTDGAACIIPQAAPR